MRNDSCDDVRENIRSTVQVMRIALRKISEIKPGYGGIDTFGYDYDEDCMTCVEMIEIAKEALKGKGT